MTDRTYNPSEGMAFQGDVSIIPVPDHITHSELHEIAPINGRLILQEGEATGHHHAIPLYAGKKPKNFRAAVKESGDVFSGISDTKLRKRLKSGSAKTISFPTAKLYRDPSVAEAMVRDKILTRADLAVGVLVVKDGEMKVTHEEHDAIILSPGRYLIGNQVESAGAEERRVID